MVVSCDRRSIILRRRNTIRSGEETVSARQLAASLWQLSATTNGFTNRTGLEIYSSFPIPNFATEGATKWDYCNTKASHDTSYFLSKFISMDSYKVKKRVDELHYEQSKSRTNTKHGIKKPNSERAPWMNMERQETRSIVGNLKIGLKMERKNRKKMDMENSKLSRYVSEAKLSAGKSMRNLEVEKETRAFLEELCNKLAKEIEGYKVEIYALRSKREKIEEETENERKMMQLAEVWREEHAQMKLQDTKLILENKFGEMNDLIAEVKSFLSKRNPERRSFDATSVQGIRDVFHILPKPNKTFKIEGKNARSEKSVLLNECKCGMEAATQDEMHSGGILVGSVNKTRKSNYKSNSFNLEREKISHHGSQKSESSEISSVSLNRPKDKSLSSRKLQRVLPRNRDIHKTISSDAIERISNGLVPSILSMDEGQIKVWKNPHVVRAMTGHIEWPREIKRRGSTEANLLEAKLESQKSILRGVLKQRS